MPGISQRPLAGVESRRGLFVETTVWGRVTGPLIDRMIADYERLGAGPIWVIQAEGATAYTADAMQEATKGFGRLFREKTLRRIVALITAPTVRMGASVVSMSLRAVGSPVEIRIVSTAAEAKTAANLPLSTE